MSIWGAANATRCHVSSTRRLVTQLGVLGLQLAVCQSVFGRQRHPMFNPNTMVDIRADVVVVQHDDVGALKEAL